MSLEHTRLRALELAIEHLAKLGNSITGYEVVLVYAKAFEKYLLEGKTEQS